MAPRGSIPSNTHRRPPAQRPRRPTSRDKPQADRPRPGSTSGCANPGQVQTLAAALTYQWPVGSARWAGTRDSAVASPRPTTRSPTHSPAATATNLYLSPRAASSHSEHTMIERTQPHPDPPHDPIRPSEPPDHGTHTVTTQNQGTTHLCPSGCAARAPVFPAQSGFGECGQHAFFDRNLQ